MAAITSNAVTGNLSAGSSWVGGTPPTTGDTIVIVNGAVITVDASITLGNNGSNVGHAFTVNGASSSSFGTLKVAAGVTLTVKGTDTTSNTLGMVNRYGLFWLQPGASLVLSPATDYGSALINNGIMLANGTSGSPITITNDPENYSWNNSVTNAAVSTGIYVFDPENNLAIGALAGVTGGGPWIANAAGTGLGQAGNSSVSFGGTGASYFTSEKSSRAAIAAPGDYAIDYQAGVVYYYWNPSGIPSAYTVSYQFLKITNGSGIWSRGGTTYNQLELDYCNISYLGPGTNTGGSSHALRISGHKTAGGGGTSQNFKLTNSTISYCTRALSLEGCTGSSGDMIRIESNTINHCRLTSSYGAFLDFRAAASSYVSVSSNVFDINAILINSGVSGFVCSQANWKINSNTGQVGQYIYSKPWLVQWSGSELASNNTAGFQSALDSRITEGAGGGGASSRFAIHDNTFTCHFRGPQFGPYMDVYNNVFIKSYHHGMTAPNGTDQYICDVQCYNNLWIGKLGGIAKYVSPVFELGYNVRGIWFDNVRVANNTVCNQGGSGGGFLDLGDSQDGTSQNLITRLVAVNNLCDQEQSAGATNYAIRRLATSDGSSNLTRCHEIQIDYNLDYSCSARYDTFVRQGTFSKGGTRYNDQASGTRNIPGLSLHEPGFSTASGKSASLTINSATDYQLTWDGGSPVQLVLDSGTAAGAANNTSNGVAALLNGSLTDTTKNWSTTLSNAACPRLHWLMITSATTGAGQVRAITNNTATVLTVAPAWTVVPTGTIAYAIIQSEVSITGSVGTTKAGIYLSDLPSAVGTYTDSGISFADNSVTGSNPGLVAPNGATAASYKFASNASPAYNAGTSSNAPAADYFGSTRPQGTGYDIGFFEYPAAAAYSLTASPGSFSGSGIAAGLTAARNLVASPGSFAEVGQAAALKSARSLFAAKGTFTETGQAAALSWSHAGTYVLSAVRGTFAVTGVAAGLKSARHMVALAGSFVETGQPASLTWFQAGKHVLIASAGVFSVSGQSAALSLMRAGRPSLRQALAARLLADPKIAAVVGSSIYPVRPPQSWRADLGPSLTYEITANAYDADLDNVAATAEARVDLTTRSLRESDGLAVAEAIRADLVGDAGDWSGIEVDYVAWGGRRTFPILLGEGSDRRMYSVTTTLEIGHQTTPNL